MVVLCNECHTAVDEDRYSCYDDSSKTQEFRARIFLQKFIRSDVDDLNDIDDFDDVEHDFEDNFEDNL